YDLCKESFMRVITYSKIVWLTGVQRDPDRPHAVYYNCSRGRNYNLAVPVNRLGARCSSP
ncbi:MAG: hypothetical protein ACI9QL_003893, partial [Candidatus Omnitrophota bacterium]